MTWTTEIPLVGSGGEPVDLKRTLMSHGVGDLPPSFIDEDRPALVTTIELAPGRARTITIERGSARTARVSVAGRRPSVADAAAVEAAVAHILASTKTSLRSTRWSGSIPNSRGSRGGPDA